MTWLCARVCREAEREKVGGEEEERFWRAWLEVGFVKGRGVYGVKKWEVGWGRRRLGGVAFSRIVGW